MPRYDYQCPNGHREEIILLRTEDAQTHIVRCPRCQELMERQPSAGNFVIHGYSARNGYSG